MSRLTNLRLWKEVKVKDSVLCGATVSACARAGQWQRAMQLLKVEESGEVKDGVDICC